MEVTENLLNWLQKSNVLKHGPVQSNQKFYIHEEDAQAFENGLRFVPLIRRVLRSDSERVQTPVPEINSLKETSSTAAKLYNWNILIKALEIINISVDSDMKALIVAGDRPIVAEILKSIYEAQLRKAENHVIDETKKKKRKLLGEGALLLDDLDTNSSLSSSENTLEFLILTICKAFGLNSKTAAGLLMQSGKFLTQILQKGLKSKFEPVVVWYKLIIDNSSLLGELVGKEKANLNFVLGSLKGGLGSKDFVVVQKACEALVSVCKTPQCADLDTWTWFSAEVYTKAFAAYDAFKEDVTTYILNLLITLGKNNLKDAFGQMIVNLYPEPSTSFSVISSFWGYIDEESPAYQDIQNQGLVNYWIEFGLRETENHQNVNSKVSALGFLCDVWLKYDKFIEQHEDLANCILTVIKRACREKSRILKVICYGRLFLLLALFSKKKNSYAAIIYKTLTFALVENYLTERIREFLLSNFLIILEEIPSLPVNILIEPYVKQTQTAQKRLFSTADFDFYISLARHPRLSIKDAVILADNLGKIYFNDFIFSSSAEIPLVLLFGRYLETRPMQEFISKLLELGLKLIYSKLKQKPKIPVKETLTKEEQEEEKNLNYFKRLLCSLSEKIIHLGNFEMNKDIKEILIVGCVEIKKISGGGIRGLKSVLELLGDATSLIDRYEISKSALVPVSDTGESRNSSRVVSISNASQKRRSLYMSKPRERALSDIERVKQMRLDKEHREKTQNDKKRIEEEKQKKFLKSQLEQRKILLGVEGRMENSEALVVKEASTVIEMPFYIIDEETKSDQEIIYTVLRKHFRVFRVLFNHYASSGYKVNNFNTKPTFDGMQDKKASLSDGELMKLLRDQCVSNNMVSTEEVRKIIAWMMQKMKLKSIEMEQFPLLLYYISQFIYTRSPYSYLQFPPGAYLLALIEQFQRSQSKVVPASFYTEPDYGVGDKDIIKALNARIKHDPNMEMPEGYKKIQEKDVMIVYKVPKVLGMSKAYRASLEIIDEILFSSLKVHFLIPNVVIFPVTTVRGFLNKPQLESEDKKMKEFRVPANKASYKVPPLPAYMSFTPGIKLEVTRLAGKYTNDLLLECARTMDDLLLTVHSNSFEIISRNPKPAGSIQNKVIQQKQTEEALLAAEREKMDQRQRMRKEMLKEELYKLRSEKKNKEIEEDAKNQQERLKEEQEKRQKLEKRNREKEENEKKIKEFKLKKEEEELSRLNKEREASQKLEEKKKKEREEFLRQAKKKLLEDMNKKKEANSEPEQKKDLRKLVMNKLVQSVNKQPKKNLTRNNSIKKDEIGNAMSDSDIHSIFNLYNKSLDSIFTYFCKLSPVSPADTSLLSLQAYSKLIKTFKIVPQLTTVDETVRIYKGIIKNKSGELGINFREFKETLMNFALISTNVVEKKIGRKIQGYSDCLTEFFNFVEIPVEPKKVLEVIRGVKV